MPTILKIKVEGAKNLPIMDRATDLTDAYVEVKFGDIIKKTDIKKRTLNPIWNQEFRFEIQDDSLIQDIPLEFKVWDKDRVSSNDIIGVVYIDLNCLLVQSSELLTSTGLYKNLISSQTTPEISGSFPIYDTIRGIRGELEISVKFDFIENDNQFKDTSPGCLFLSTSMPSLSFRIEKIIGFVEELIVENDPEYHWFDNFRASRISNEERQLLLYKLSGKLRRLIGSKAIELGGNGILAYHQHFDFEGETGIVARGYGTACLISINNSISNINQNFINSGISSRLSTSHENTSSNNNSLSPPLNITKKLSINLNSESSDAQLVTLRSFQPNQLLQFGGLVMAISIKLLSQLSSKESEEIKERDEWWREIREEIKNHAKFLECNAVIGYKETNTIQHDEGLCILTAYGTAAVLPNWFININPPPLLNNTFNEQTIKIDEHNKTKKNIINDLSECSFCHIPYKPSSSTDIKIIRCNICKKYYVPEILLTTVELPLGIVTAGRGIFLEARVCKEKKKGEYNATELNKAMPFVEHQLHQQIMYKLKVLGMNAVFSLKFQLSLNQNLILAVASCTAVFLPALPTPPALQINRSEPSLKWDKIEKLSKNNRTQLQNAPRVKNISTNISTSPTYILNNEFYENNLKEKESTQNLEEFIEEKLDETYIVDVDDKTDNDIMTVLLEPSIPKGFSICNTEEPPGDVGLLSNMQLLVAIKRIEWSIDSDKLNQQFASIFQNLYLSVMFKVKSLVPCCICSLNVDVKLPDENELQIILTAMIALETQPKNKLESQPLYKHPMKTSELVNLPITSSDEDENKVLTSSPISSLTSPSTSPLISRPISSSTNLIMRNSLDEEETQFTMDPILSKKKQSVEFQENDIFSSIHPHSVELTPISFIPSTKLIRYLGRIHLHFIKESFTIREQGGLSGFSHTFLTEINAIVRSHVASLGGNALIGYRIDECDIMENSSKNQGYCLISISGDAVLVSKINTK